MCSPQCPAGRSSIGGYGGRNICRGLGEANSLGTTAAPAGSAARKETKDKMPRARKLPALAHTTHWPRILSPRVLGETSRAPGRPSIAWRNAVSAPEGTSLLLQRHSICMGKGCPVPRAPAPGVGGPSTSLQDLQRLGPALAAPRHSSHPARSCRSQGWMRKALSNAASPGHAFRFVTLWKFNPSPVTRCFSRPL